MKKTITSAIIATVITAGCAVAYPYKIDGVNFYEMGNDGNPWFTVDKGKDLIDLDNINCEWSHGGTADCATIVSPFVNFPKDSMSIQSDIVRSGDVAWKFANGEGDCGQHGKSGKGLDDCTTNRERSEVSMNAFKTGDRDYWFKFSMFIPEDSVFDAGISNSVWQIHSKKGPVNFQFLVGPQGDLLWTDFINSSFGGPEHKEILAKDFVKGQWNDFVVKITFVEFPNTGHIKVWANSKLVVDYAGKTNNGVSKQNYMKFGIYKSNIHRFNNKYIGKEVPNRGTSIVYYDAIAIGDSCNEINLENEGNSCSNLK